MTSAIDAGIIAAAAAPCTDRATISAASDGASPQAAEAIVNSPSPPQKARRAPIRSDSDPADSSSAANISVYPSTTHCRPVIPPASSRRISGSATFTITASRVTMKNPSSAAARDHAGERISSRPAAVTAPAAVSVEALMSSMQPAAAREREVALSLVMTEPPSLTRPDVP